MRRLSARRIAALVVCALPLAAAAEWIFDKRVRVLAPHLVTGITCVSEVICVDDVARAAHATALYDEAVRFVGERVAPFNTAPRAIFCSTDACYESFGFERSSAEAVGRFGIVLSPRAWTPYYVRHELIHHVQSERLGYWRARRSPKWFSEGMAYSLSEDPRRPLGEPWEAYRARFDAWYRERGKDGLWVRTPED